MVDVHERVITTITIDECKSGQHRLAEMVASVKRELAGQKHDAEIEC